MQIMSIECVAQKAKDDLAKHLQNACKSNDIETTITEIQEAIKAFLGAHKKSNSIARVRMLTEYVANKRFNHSDPVKMLQTAFNRTRKAWDCKTK